MTLLAVPNVSEGRDAAAIDAVGRAFASDGVRLLDVHVDADHDRTVFTLAGAPGTLAGGLLAGGREVVARVHVPRRDGAHPHVGALDVAPLVYLDEDDRGAACAEALVAGDLLARELALPVFLYGLLGGGRTRADLRRGGLAELTRRMGGGELAPDFGPTQPHRSAGVALVAARPPLVAFNLELAAPATPDDARRIAERIREGGADGLPGVRAIGLALERRGVAQVSVNVEDHRATSLADVAAAVRAHAPVAAGELVGLAPAAAFDGFPADIPLPGFDSSRHLIENALKS